MFRALISTIIITLASACGPSATTVPPTNNLLPVPTIPPPTEPPISHPTPLPTSTPKPSVSSSSQIIHAESLDRLEMVAAFDLPDSFINTVIFSPDNLRLVTADMNGEVLFWECGTWEKSQYLPARSQGADDSTTGIYFGGILALSPDGNTIVTAYGEDGVVTGRDREGQELFNFSFGSRVLSIAISPNGKFLAVGGMKINVLIFDLETKQPIADLVSDHEYITNVVFSPDSSILVVSYERPSNVMKVWNTTTWQERTTFTHTTERFDYHDLLFSPDGQELVIASTEDIEIKFLDLASMQIIREFPEHSRAPYSITFSPDGSLLASAGDDGTVRFWNMETGENVKTIRTGQEAMAIAFSPDGELIAYSVQGEGIHVWAIKG